MIYRQGAVEDIDELQQLAALSYGVYKHVLSEEHWLKLEHFLNDRQKFEHLLQQSTCFVCVCQGKIVGMAFVILSGNPWDIFPANWAYIRMVGVNPDCQGKGIARRLTQKCIDFAKQNEESTIALHTSEFMDAARHVYEKLGFVQIREIEPRFGKRYWLYTLGLEAKS